MGLDQYLSAKNYLSPAKWREQETNEMFEKVVTVTGTTALLDKHFPSVQCQFSVGYWRKANAIHRWFVENCQDGEDDCREASVSHDELEELLKLAKSVKENPSLASELLPTTEGFFFGSTEYGEMYYEDIDLTIEIIERVLAEVPRDWQLTYQSSW
jgi:hypothetical protein